jgi:hypothetical protein
MNDAGKKLSTENDWSLSMPAFVQLGGSAQLGERGTSVSR